MQTLNFTAVTKNVFPNFLPKSQLIATEDGKDGHFIS